MQLLKESTDEKKTDYLLKKIQEIEPQIKEIKKEFGLSETEFERL